LNLESTRPDTGFDDRMRRVSKIKPSKPKKNAWGKKQLSLIQKDLGFDVRITRILVVVRFEISLGLTIY
jgi:hypothetical protein